MDSVNWLSIAIFVLGIIVLVGFFITKAKGFGRFSTSVVLLFLVLILSTLLYANGKLDEKVIASILFAVFGFAGGLFTNKGSEN
ncbi:MAG: hypothetical protein COA92_04690 [Sulfurovum sp.]|nr:MAG: hypothetical protein COA92_04690 [Sulfurovum sp.]